MIRANHPEKIAILGGGLGALATAFELTSSPDWQSRYAVTVYQQGFRLGGKCASSRRPEAHDRIEEHGVHVWMGVYENAFRMIRRCYEELDRAPGQPLATWREAFAPQDDFTLEEQTDAGWVHWPVRYPPNQRLPGDGDALFLSAAEYARMALSFLGDALREPMSKGPSAKAIAGSASVATALLAAARALPTAVGRGRLDEAVGHVTRVGEAILALGLGADSARRLRILIELATAAVRGVVADDLVERGFSTIDGEDLADWLRRHGASSTAVESPIVRGFYDLAIAYAGGDPARPRFAAGASLRAGLRMLLTTKGSIFYEMQAGMGETVIAPIYQVLARRGVKFELFHRVERLHPSDDGLSIATIDVARQATCKEGVYQPLIDVKGLACWPADPLFDQLVEGEALREGGVDLESSRPTHPEVELRRLRAGVDFDRVVLAIPVSALQGICAELGSARADWRALLGNVGSVATQAAQLWLRPSARELGWRSPKTIVSGYALPFSVWADLSHLVARERWPSKHEPASCAYLCGPLADAATSPDGDGSVNAKQSVRGQLEGWLDAHAAHLWPRSVPAGENAGFDYGLLVDPGDRVGKDRLEAQYYRANVNPTDRYIQSLPGTTRYRMRTDQSGYENLFLAGDWIKTGLDLGCVEAAVMSGFQAARAISGEWRFLPGEDDFRDAPVAPRRGDAPGRAAVVLTPGSAGASSSLPRYVDRGGEQTICHPVRFENARVRAHFLHADGARLAELCAQCFTAPSGGRIAVRPAAPVTALVVAEIGRAASTVEPDRGIGWASEIDVGFWVPVFVRDTERGGEHFAWYHPYLFVDSEYAVASGRESFGFHKMLGTFEIPGALDSTRPISVDTMVVHPRGARGAFKRLIDVRRLDGSAGDDDRAGDDGALFGSLGALLPGLAGRVAGGLSGFEAPMIFLKQFRAISDGKRACYQAIVEAPARLATLRAMGRLRGRYEVEIQAYESHPIARELGLRAGRLTPLASAHADFDFVMDVGRELWRAGAEGDHDHAGPRATMIPGPASPAPPRARPWALRTGDEIRR
jgi:uncharacterized protein with NAD-binding domain and iron-sulfur cluster